MRFGKLLRQLRTDTGLGIKKLAPELGVNYTYLSKLENDETRPSEELIKRIANYFDCDSSQLFLASGRVPPDVLKILQEHPDDAVEFLRERFGRSRGKP